MNKRSKIIIYIILGFVFIFLLGFILANLKKPVSQSDKIQAVASFYPLYFFSQEIGGNKADIINITPAGTEPHDYEPTAQDIARIEKSKLLILNGGGLEAWEEDIKKNLNYKRTIIVAVSEGLANLRVMERGSAITDPHIWLDPLMAKEIADKIAQGFVEVDPANKDYYLLNANALKDKLDGLDKEFKQGLSNCKDKNIITAHSAFGYLAAAYGLDQVSIAGLSPDEEPSPKQLADIVEFAKTNKVKYIFFESLVSPKLANTIANEAGVETLVLNPIEGLSKAEIDRGRNYFTEMQSNLANLKIALQCE